MESIDEMLARLATSDGGETEQKGQDFTLNPTRVREALSGLVKEDRAIWLKHLLQLIHDVPQESAPLLCEQANGNLLLNFFPQETEFAFDLIQQSYGQLLGHSVASRLARILVELGPTAQLLHSQSPGQALSLTEDELSLVPANTVIVSGVALHFSFRSLTVAPKLFGWGHRQAIAEVETLSGLHPLPIVLEKGPPITPDWPFPPPTNDDDDRPKLWDWETVLPASEGGFRWTVASWGESLSEVNDEGETFSIVRHPLEVRRSYTEHPLMGCYPASITQQLQLTSTPTLSHLNVQASRVFGISWTSAAHRNSLIIPLIKGVPGRPITIEGAPPGIFVLADASHLKTDASRVALVRDEAMEAWQSELLDWTRQQTVLYLPYLEQIPGIWMKRARRWKDAENPPGGFAERVKWFVSRIYSLPPVRKLLTRRKAQIEDWIARRDSLRS